jgi:hypothetical protein
MDMQRIGTCLFFGGLALAIFAALVTSILDDRKAMKKMARRDDLKN